MSVHASRNPLSDGFDFHRLGRLTEQNAVIYTPPGEAEPGMATGYEIGTFEKNMHSSVSVNINPGRYGLPRLAINFYQRGFDRPIAGVTFEPGLFELVQGGHRMQQLEFIDLKTLGKAGGGGHMYQHDPQNTVKNHNAKKCIGRFNVIVNRCEVLPTLQGLNAYRNSLAPNSGEARFINDLMSLRRMRFRFYIRVAHEGVWPTLQDTVLQPLQHCIQLKVPAFHQYISPTNVINLNMPLRHLLRDRIYCDRDANGQMGPDGGNMLSDTKGRCHAKPVYQVHRIGVVREYQAQIERTSKLCTYNLTMTIRRNPRNLLTCATDQSGAIKNVAVPQHEHMYTGAVVLPLGTRHYVPHAGTMFDIVITQIGGPLTFKTSGVVLDVSESLLQRRNCAFILCLLIVPDALLTMNLDQDQIVLSKLTHIPCDQLAARKLDLLKMFEGPVTSPGPAAFQLASTTHLTTLWRISRDIRDDPNVWDNCIADCKAYGHFKTAMTTTETQFLSQVPVKFIGYTLLVQTLQSDSMRVIFAFVLALAATGRQVIIVSNSLEARRQYARSLLKCLESARSKKGLRCDSFWSTARLLSYATVACKSDTALRLQAHRECLLDDFPEHDWVADETAGVTTHCPLSTGLGRVAQRLPDTKSVTYHSRLDLLLRTFRDRARLADARATLGEHSTMRIINDRRKHVLRVLQDTEILVTDTETAMNDIVQESFSDPFLVMVDAHDMLFSDGAAVIAANPNFEGALICAPSTADPEEWLTGLASTDPQNEALTSFGRSLWGVLTLAGEQVLVLG